MAIILMISFFLSLIAPVLLQIRRRIAGIAIALLPLSLFGYFSLYISKINKGEYIVSSLSWVPQLGIDFSFHLDGLSLLFTLLITGIGTLITLYAVEYMKGHEFQSRFQVFFLLFMSSMLGLVLADNLISLFIFWELTSITSYLLIGFNNHEEKARTNALQALLVTGGGGLALLGGVILLSTGAGTYQISEILSTPESIITHPYFTPAVVLIFIGSFTKSAQFPFHFWLPNAMSAPTPVSAYLHSATMVKAGIYLLARLFPLLHHSFLWNPVVIGIGSITMIIGALMSLSNNDLKRILAYSTISALGTMTMLLGMGSDLAIKALMVFIVAHALYKGSLFMIAGTIDHSIGTRNVEKLSGLRYIMPVFTTITGLSVVSMAGIGPLLNFISKEMIFDAAIAFANFNPLLIIITILSVSITVAVSLIIYIKPFFGKLSTAAHIHHPLSFELWVGSFVLGCLGLIFGLFPSILAIPLIEPSVSTILGKPTPLKLSLWHGLTPTLGYSVLAILTGVLIYVSWLKYQGYFSKITSAINGPETLYQVSLTTLNKIAVLQTNILQNGNLRFYLITIISSSLVFLGSLLLWKGGFHWPASIAPITLFETALAILIIAATITVLQSSSRLGTIAALGVIGYSIALIYLRFGAPDLAMTQFLIESITVVLFVFAFYHLPRFERYSSKPAQTVQICLSLFTGLLMTVLVISAVEVDLFPSISTYFLESALPLAHGRNIVNVILVDFRGLDTLGEITVLAVAATGVFAIIKYRSRKERS